MILRLTDRFLFLAALAALPAIGTLHGQDNPGSIGPYADGHASYALTDVGNGNRPVSLMVWYPVDPNAIQASAPIAQYPLDPYSTNLPVSTSKDWETLGYGPAYEGRPPSGQGPFPLVVFSPGFGSESWQYIYLGTRLVTHG